MATTLQSTPTGWLPIRQYRDFWDVPRMFFIESEGKSFLFDCRFDDELEDFSTAYQIYQMPPIAEAELEGSWADFPKKAIRLLGSIPVSAVSFDSSRKAAVDGRILATILPIGPIANVSIVESNVRA